LSKTIYYFKIFLLKSQSHSPDSSGNPGSGTKPGEELNIPDIYGKKLALENYIELLKLILPELILEHFDLVNTKTEQEKMHLFFEEKNTPPKEYNNRQLISKGFLNEITIQDFPLRGKFVYLHIKRRRWTDKESQEIIQRDWNIIAKGTRMTQEFADFLKDINRY